MFMMKAFPSSCCLLILKISLILVVDAQQRIDCLTNNDKFLSIRPGDTVGNHETTTSISNEDKPHLVSRIGEDDVVVESGDSEILRVFLAGTGRGPSDYSCLLDSLVTGLSSSARVIGLSYGSHDTPDAVRNIACGSLTENSEQSRNEVVARCLAYQHKDALFGSPINNARNESSFPGAFPYVPRNDSVIGRLTNLLGYLARERPEVEGWGSYLADGKLRWDRIWVMGHSQGAGHATYLAQQYALAGAGLFSGPQDELLTVNDDGADDDFTWWINDPFKTKNIMAMAHQNESAIMTIQSNWKRMEPFRDVEASVITSTDGQYDLLHKMKHPWITRYDPQPNHTCQGRPYHCSVALDMNAPLLPSQPSRGMDGLDNQGNPYLYSKSIWPGLAGAYVYGGDSSTMTNTMNGTHEESHGSRHPQTLTVVVIAAISFLVAWLTNRAE